MAHQVINQKLLELYRWDQLREVFYPLSAVASYSLMYLLTRVTAELPVRRIVDKLFEGISFDGYAGLEPVDFDFLLVEATNGSDRVFRHDRVQLAAANRSTEFTVIVDDAASPGEQDTVTALIDSLKQRGMKHSLNRLTRRMTQAASMTWFPLGVVPLAK